MSQMYPTESNKEISKRLGNGWKTLNDTDRRRFFEKAKALGLQHKKEYPDYVYNPKEARIRKAMRDANRDRSIGASPMLPRPNLRRAPHNNWLPPHEDLIMSQLGPTPICGGFPLPPNGNNQFMSTMNNGGYSKLEPPRPPPPTSMSSSTSNTSLHTDYMQPNPLAQLQQHTEMWHDYQTIRSRPSGNSYMMTEPYHPDAATSMMIEKQQNIENDVPIQPSLSDCNSIQRKNHEVGDFDGKTGLESTQNANSQDHFMPVFEQTANGVETRFDPIAERINKAKKADDDDDVDVDIVDDDDDDDDDDIDESFLIDKKLLNDPDYQNNYILEYLKNAPSMSLMNITIADDCCFPFAIFKSSESIKNEIRVFENVPEPVFVYTDVGYVPVT